MSLSITIPDEVVELAAGVVAKRAAELLRDELDQRSPWMTTEEAAEYLRVPLGTFKERAGHGEFDGIAKREGRRMYFHRSDLDAHRRAGGIRSV
jgi:excisionase family DNA binding protein